MTKYYAMGKLWQYMYVTISDINTVTIFLNFPLLFQFSSLFFLLCLLNFVLRAHGFVSVNYHGTERQYIYIQMIMYSSVNYIDKVIHEYKAVDILTMHIILITWFENRHYLLFSSKYTNQESLGNIQWNKMQKAGICIIIVRLVHRSLYRMAPLNICNR